MAVMLGPRYVDGCDGQVNDVLDGHVDLDLECPDRIYLNGYVPNLQVGGQVVSLMTAHQGYPIPSPAIMEKLGVAFRRAVQRFAADNEIPILVPIETSVRHVRRESPTGCGEHVVCVRSQR